MLFVLPTGCNQKKVAQVDEPIFFGNIAYDFTYIDSEGNLRIKNFAYNRDDILIEGELKYSSEYDVNWQEQLVAYVHTDETHFDREFVLYNLKTKERKVLSDDAHIGRVKWSPNRRYLLLDVGTYIWRGVSIYDSVTDTVTPIEFSLFYGDSPYYDVLENSWSPDGTKIAVGIEEKVTPETPVGDGESVTTVVLDVVNGLAMNTVARGTSNFRTQPLFWLDGSTIIIEKRHFYDNTRLYEAINFVSNVVTEISDVADEVSDSGISKIDIPEEIKRYHRSISPDEKYVLYEKEGNIFLHALETGATSEIGKGSATRWQEPVFGN